VAKRLIELYLPPGTEVDLEDLFGEDAIRAHWVRELGDGGTETTLLLDVNESEGVLDQLEERFSEVEGYRIVLLAVEASLPREDEASTSKENGNAKERAQAERVSREELYHDIAENAKLGTVYVVLVALSTIVAAIGMVRDSVAVIIGAMVIAPLLGPNVAFALGLTLGDLSLAKRAALVNLTGIVTALAIAVGIGFFLSSPLDSEEILSRTSVTLSDIALALASGAAGALSFTSGAPAAVIGVMVAVALLPPLTGFGMLMGAGETIASTGALLLFLCNVICINLAAVGTFFLQGIRPARWFEAERAKRASIVAVGFWVLLLAALAALIVFADPESFRLTFVEAE
jgi:uncharacterized hydrophobic protein (TIGR00341 family)